MPSRTLYPVMSLSGPVQPGHATWVGEVDAADIGDGRIKLGDSAGFGRARLLIRDNGSVRGYVKLPIVEGGIDSDALRTSVRNLPEVPPARPIAERPITVIVCTRDRVASLRTALTSIAKLTYSDYEVIVVDNAPSNSETQEMVTSEFSHFVYLREDTPGLSHARNAGLAAAKNEVVAFTDDDVMVDASWLLGVARGFSEARDVACVSGLVPSGELRNSVQEAFDASVTWPWLTRKRVFRLRTRYPDLPLFPFSAGDFGTGANFAVERAVAQSVGGFDTALGAGTRTKGGEDLDMFLRILFAGKAVVLEPTAIVWHRHRTDRAGLDAQAVGYGRGFSAWATTVLLDPAMTWMAIRCLPKALTRLRRKSAVPVELAQATEKKGTENSSAELERVSRLEFASMFAGPFAYFSEQREQRAAGTLGGPRADTRIERPLWAGAALVAGLLGLLASIPSPEWLSLSLLLIFLLVGPGAVVAALVRFPAFLVPVVVPAIGVSASILMTTALVFAGWWAPSASLVVFAGVTCVAALIAFTSTEGVARDRTR